MKTEPNESSSGYGYANQHIIRSEKGLTKREHFAAIAMQGILSSKLQISPELVTDYAVEYADALIEALNKNK